MTRRASERYATYMKKQELWEWVQDTFDQKNDIIHLPSMRMNGWGYNIKEFVDVNVLKAQRVC